MGSALDICASHRKETIEESPKLCAVHRKDIDTIEELKVNSLFPVEDIFKRKRRRHYKLPKKKKNKDNNVPKVFLNYTVK